ncbi:hypothetical protein ABIC28_004358 [Rhodococcus sp. PvR044]|uniref:GIY-YIG nuclease family protein n=1 Tax=Rhodococcus sp. PvR044 TaxID=3156402 RepID=UPI00339A60FD
MTRHSVGFVYVLSNASMPGLVKVGCTSRLAEDRAKELQTTGVPTQFLVEFRILTSHPESVEKHTHESLDAERVSPNREFFTTPVEEAIQTVREAALLVDGIDARATGPTTYVGPRDRVVLSLRAGELFFVIGHPNGPLYPPQVLDIWQAQSDGDALELYGTDNPEHVSSFSAADSFGHVDPVPYIDRQATSLNGTIIGKESLDIGDRILWIHHDAQSGVCATSLIESSCHCQVVNRTWNPRVDISGFPRILNLVDEDVLVPSLIPEVRKVLASGPPRTVSATGRRLRGETPSSEDPPHSEYWLPALSPKPKRGKTTS